MYQLAQKRLRGTASSSTGTITFYSPELDGIEVSDSSSNMSVLIESHLVRDEPPYTHSQILFFTNQIILNYRSPVLARAF